MKEKTLVKKRPSGLNKKELWAKPITNETVLSRIKKSRISSILFYEKVLWLKESMEVFGLTKRRMTYEQATLMIVRLIRASENLIELRKNPLKKGDRVVVRRTESAVGTVLEITWDYQVKIRFDPGQSTSVQQWQKVETLPAWDWLIKKIS